MPWLGRQCSTTVSPGFIVVTPGPISITCADASWPRRCGRNLSGPLAAAISLSWAPHIVNRDLYQDLADAERLGQLDLVDDKRLARLHQDRRLRCLDLHRDCLFEIDEFVVAGIAEMVIQPDPFRRMQN